jgi:hypothetical protein
MLATALLAASSRAEDAGTAHGLPTPPQALTEAFQGMAGTWECKSKFGSGSSESKSTMVIQPALNGFAYSGEVTVEKNAMLPVGLKQQLYWSYDTSTHKLVEFVADSYGDLQHGTSDGLKADTVVWEEDSVMMATATKSRTSVKRMGPKELQLTFEAQTDGKWAAFGTKRCKKQ